MKKFWNIGAAAVVLLVASCEKSEDSDNVSAQDRNFVTQMSLSNRTEISLGQLAASMATNDSVRMYAQMMVAEHTMADSTLGLLASDLEITVPADSLDANGMTLRSTLMTLSGRAFDSAYITSQVPAHQMALNIAQTEINTGTNGELRDFANRMSPNIQAHLTLADSISARFR